MGNNKKRRAPEVDTRKFRKKTSILTYEGIKYVDYKDVNLLRKFMSERAKIRQRAVTGNSQKQQREIAKAIRISREMALLPFNVRQVTSKSKKRRDGDDEGTLDNPDGERRERAPRGDRTERAPRTDRTDAPAQDVDAEAKALVESEAVTAGEEA